MLKLMRFQCICTQRIFRISIQLCELTEVPISLNHASIPPRPSLSWALISSLVPMNGCGVLALKLFDSISMILFLFATNTVTSPSILTGFVSSYTQILDLVPSSCCLISHIRNDHVTQLEHPICNSRFWNLLSWPELCLHFFFLGLHIWILT